MYLFLDSKNIGFHSSWSWWNRHVPLLMFHLCHRLSPLLIQINIQCRPIRFSYYVFFYQLLTPPLALLLHYESSPSRLVSLYSPHHHCQPFCIVACSHLSSLPFFIVFPLTNQSTLHFYTHLSLN